MQASGIDVVSLKLKKISTSSSGTLSEPNSDGTTMQQSLTKTINDRRKSLQNIAHKCSSMHYHGPSNSAGDILCISVVFRGWGIDVNELIQSKMIIACEGRVRKIVFKAKMFYPTTKFNINIKIICCDDNISSPFG